MQANQAIAEQFIKDISGIDVSKYVCRSSDGSIEFYTEAYVEPMGMAARITRNLGVRYDSNFHNGIEMSWDLPNERRMFFVMKDWGRVSFGLVDFKAYILCVA